MPLNFNSIVKLGLCAVLVVSTVFYALVFVPSTYILPISLKSRARGYMVRLVEMGFRALFSDSFSIALTGDAIDYQENAIVLLNHQGLLDYFLLFFLRERVRLYFYIYGYCVRFPTARVIFSAWYNKSNWVVPPRSLEATFQEFDRTAAPKWVVIFPEVRPWTAARARENQLYCRLAGAPVLKSLLYPRFPSVVQGIDYARTSVTALYDLRVRYHPGAPAINALISTDKWRVDVAVKRIRISKVPRDQKRAERFLEKLWYRKDRELERGEGPRRTRAGAAGPVGPAGGPMGPA